MEKINVAELLKDCPKGMELNCTIYEGAELNCVTKDKNYPIRIIIKDDIGGNIEIPLTKEGYYNMYHNPKCVIFPKGKTTWEGFVPPCKFKDGDIVYTRCDDGDGYIFIFENITKDTYVNSYLHLKGDELRIIKVWLTNCDDKYLRLATEEEKARLFKAIKDNGYRWNEETKTLEKLVQPKFKVGDRVKHKDSGIYCTLGEYSEGISAYRTNIGLSLTQKDLEQWELAPSKFDISTLVPFESKVLVRDGDNDIWCPAIWGCTGIPDIDIYPYIVIGGVGFDQCIPYEGNEHLYRTTKECDEYYKTWE